MSNEPKKTNYFVELKSQLTFAPNRCHTDPNSTPMTPAPITIRCSGTFLRDRAPVEDTIVSSSISIPVNAKMKVTDEPTIEL